MKTLNKFILLMCLSTITINTSKAQGLDGKFNINFSAGISFLLNANINCEYQITNSSYISFGYGRIVGPYNSTSHFDITHIFLKGNNNHYFEFGYGVIFIDLFDLLVLPDFGFGDEIYNDILPQMTILPNIRLGYRKMNDYNSTFFRTGVSLAEGIYVGIGYSF